MANSNNSVILKGHLGVDPKFTTMANGREVANIFILTNRPDYKDGEGKWQKREPQKNNVSVFTPKGIERLKAMSKGSGIEVRASVEIREFTVKGTGEVRNAVEIVCNDRWEGHLVKAWSPTATAKKDEAE